jgi:hypothetical protein
VEINNFTKKLTFNTTLPADEEIIVRINSMFGQSPAELKLRVIVSAIPDYVFNLPPSLRTPPSGVNLVVHRKEKSFSASIRISEVFDDYNEPEYLNFSNRDLGKLTYKFDDDTAILNINKSSCMTYNPSSTDLTFFFTSY